MKNNLYPVDFFAVFDKPNVINIMGCKLNRDI